MKPFLILVLCIFSLLATSNGIRHTTIQANLNPIDGEESYLTGVRIPIFRPFGRAESFSGEGSEDFRRSEESPNSENTIPSSSTSQTDV